MRILLDECVHVRVKAAFEGHVVQTVAEMGWRSSKDDWLLLNAQNRFDVFVTVDKRIEVRARAGQLKMGIVIAHIRNNELSSYLPLYDALRDAVESVRAGEVAHVGGSQKNPR